MACWLRCAGVDAAHSSFQCFFRRPALAHTAAADDLQKGTGTGIDQATKGTTDITSDKFQARDKDGEKDAKDTTAAVGVGRRAQHGR